MRSDNDECAVRKSSLPFASGEAAAFRLLVATGVALAACSPSPSAFGDTIVGLFAVERSTCGAPEGSGPTIVNVRSASAARPPPGVGMKESGPDRRKGVFDHEYTALAARVGGQGLPRRVVSYAGSFLRQADALPFFPGTISISPLF